MTEKMQYSPEGQEQVDTRNENPYEGLPDNEKKLVEGIVEEIHDTVAYFKEKDPEKTETFTQKELYTAIKNMVYEILEEEGMALSPEQKEAIDWLINDFLTQEKKQPSQNAKTEKKEKTFEKQKSPSDMQETFNELKKQYDLNDPFDRMNYIGDLEDMFSNDSEKNTQIIRERERVSLVVLEKKGKLKPGAKYKERESNAIITADVNTVTVEISGKTFIYNRNEIKDF